MDDIAGGSFTISNPGIFGSMFGTPLINYPQSAVFNINSIKEEPVAIDGRIEIRPVKTPSLRMDIVVRRLTDKSQLMYITLTYDHRLIDGREAVRFLNLVKGYIEDPAKLLLG